MSAPWRPRWANPARRRPVWRWSMAHRHLEHPGPGPDGVDGEARLQSEAGGQVEAAEELAPHRPLAGQREPGR